MAHWKEGKRGGAGRKASEAARKNTPGLLTAPLGAGLSYGGEVSAMRIGEVCRECGLTKKAIAYYGEQGLIVPAMTENGYRRYTAADVARLKKIATLRKLGLSVSEIRAVLEKGILPAARDIADRRELDMEALRERQALLRQLADEGDWERIRARADALENKQSLLRRLLEAFPGYYGKWICLHFAPFLDDPIATQDQRDAWQTLIRFLDEQEIDIPQDLRAYMDEMTETLDTDRMKRISEALAAAVRQPEQYFRDHRDALAQYQAVMASEAYRQTPAYRLKAHLEAWQRQSGYNDVFIPAMRRLSPAYEAYHRALEKANEVFLRQRGPQA